jgi:hypothetical protein
MALSIIAPEFLAADLASGKVAKNVHAYAESLLEAELATSPSELEAELESLLAEPDYRWHAYTLDGDNATLRGTYVTRGQAEWALRDTGGQVRFGTAGEVWGVEAH